MPIRITDHLAPELMRLPLRANNKRDAITELVDLLSENGRVNNRDRLLAAVLEREAQRTTGVGRGLAIPHAKTDACGRLAVAFGRCASPIDFQSIDAKPVQVIVLLGSPPEQTSAHIQMLARLSALVKSDAVFRSVVEAPDAAALMEVLRRQDDGG